MFEKEADFAETKMLINCNGDYSKKKDYKKGWQDGAEFGYNKAKEEMQEQDYSLVDFVMQYENGKFKCKYKSGKEFESVDGKTWKEIVHPKDQLEVLENYINDIPNVIDPCSQCQFKDRYIWDNLEKCRECCYYYPSNFKIDIGKTKL